MVYQGLETEVGSEDIITIMPISHGGSPGQCVEEGVETYKKRLENLEKICRVEYYTAPGDGGLAASIEKILHEECGEGAYFIVLGKKFLVSPRVAIAAIARLERVRRRSRFIARKPSIELLLRILGTRNISKAVEKIGSVGVGEKNIVLIICTECSTNRLESVLRRVNPDEEMVREGLRNIASLCLEEGSRHVYGNFTTEDLEKLVISCGASLELEQ